MQGFPVNGCSPKAPLVPLNRCYSSSRNPAMAPLIHRGNLLVNAVPTAAAWIAVQSAACIAVWIFGLGNCVFTSRSRGD